MVQWGAGGTWIVSGEGPTKAMPSSSQRRANVAFSDRNPYPGWMTSTPCSLHGPRTTSKLASHQHWTCMMVPSSLLNHILLLDCTKSLLFPSSAHGSPTHGPIWRLQLSIIRPRTPPMPASVTICKNAERQRDCSSDRSLCFYSLFWGTSRATFSHSSDMCFRCNSCIS